MKYSIILILTILILSSCYTQRAALRDLNKIKVHHPELITESKDTIIEIWEVIKEVPIKGTTLEEAWDWDFQNQDTFYQVTQDTFVRTEVRLIRDTIIKVSVRTEVFPDTIEIIVNDTIQKIVFKTDYTTAVEKTTPWTSKIMMGLLGVGLLLLIIFILRRKKESS